MVASSLLKGISLGMLAPAVDTIVLNRPLTAPSWVPGELSRWLTQISQLGQMQKLHICVGVLAILFVLKNVVVFFQTVWMNDVALRFLRDIRQGLYRQYQRLSLNFFSGERTGELVSRITYDVSVLQNTITEGITGLIYESAQVLVFTAMIVTINWKLALVALILFPAIGYPIVQIGRMLRKLGFLVQERMADINSRIIETVQGIRIIKAFTAEERETQRFAVVNQGYYKANVRTVKRREALAGVTELIGIAGILFVLEMGGRAVFQQGELSPGTFFLFLGALISLVQPFKKLSRIHSINQQALTAAKRVGEILETEPAVKESSSPATLAPFRRQIQFEGVSFQYGDRTILRRIDLTVRAGEILAIVGASGAGKTTLVNLIPRFYDPTAGRVMIDGVDIREVSLESLRQQVGLVTQEAFLFHDTVYNNIAFGCPNASDQEVMLAAQAANADGFIQKLPLSYHSMVGESGTRLSGGERQRLAIARAILKDPPILILDEATSQLDSESESLVQEALERLMAGRTVLVISHRLSTIRSAHRIIVLDQGTISEIGRHEELMEASPLYRRLYELQV